MSLPRSNQGPRPSAAQWRFGAAVSAVALAALCWPAARPDLEGPDEATAFRWDADALFASLETEFARRRGMALDSAEAAMAELEEEGRALLAGLSSSEAVPSAVLARLSVLQMEIAVTGAAHASLLPRASDYLVASRTSVMKAAARWPRDRSTHEALYRIVFGGRIALDEALMQAGTYALPAFLHLEEIASATPFIVVEGVPVHSGDVLLSRGGAPTSALIARGNDFPNTFSHVALAHVDADTGEGLVIESLIEAGSVVSSVSDYLESKKHRILVLRLRPDHPALIDDPLLPHRAAESMLRRVREAHVPYDFAMRWDDASTMFCSEIVYHAYEAFGIDLWPLRSSMSAPGLVDWLAAMGVREFTSLVPSDIEYDPRLGAVVEWRNAPALLDYRLDNAIIDVLLEEADRGARLGYRWYMLPLARGLKAVSVAQGLLGGAPAIPQGMSASTALRVDALVSGISPVLKEDLLSRVEGFRSENGYEAPYWVLVQMAREALAARRGALSPALEALASPSGR